MIQSNRMNNVCYRLHQNLSLHVNTGASTQFQFVEVYNILNIALKISMCFHVFKNVLKGDVRSPDALDFLSPQLKKLESSANLFLNHIFTLRRKQIDCSKSSSTITDFARSFAEFQGFEEKR